MILPQPFNLNINTLFGEAQMMGCSAFILCIPRARPCVRCMRSERIIKFSSTLKAFMYPSWKRKIYILFPMRWLSNVGLSLFCLIEIMFLKDLKRKAYLRSFWQGAGFLKINNPCRWASFYKIVLTQYPADHLGGKEVSWWGVNVSNLLVMETFLPDQEKGSHGETCHVEK